jgi:hypothetical protein
VICIVEDVLPAARFLEPSAARGWCRRSGVSTEEASDATQTKARSAGNCRWKPTVRLAQRLV